MQDVDNRDMESLAFMSSFSVCLVNFTNLHRSVKAAVLTLLLMLEQLLLKAPYCFTQVA